MDLNLFITTAQGTDPRASRVVSLSDNAPFPLPAIVFGDRLNVTVYLVDGAGAYNAASGAVGYAPRLAIGARGQAALAYTETFTQIANGWTCTLDLTTTELLQALSALRAGTLALEFSTTATGPTPTTWASLPIEIIGHVSDPESGTAIAEPTYYTAAQADALFATLTQYYQGSVINLSAITALRGGGATDLDGISAADLTNYGVGAIVRLFLTGSIMVDYRLRANTGVETESTPWRILCDNYALRLWELVGVWKQGVPCVWNPDLSKFHQLLAAGSGTAVVLAPAQEADAFIIPD